MPARAFPLTSLLDLRRHRVDAALAEVGRRRAARDAAIRTCREIADRILDTQKRRTLLQARLTECVGRVSPDALVLHQERIAFLEAEREQLRQSLFQAEIARREREQELAQAQQDYRRAQNKLDALLAQREQWRREQDALAARAEEEAALELIQARTGGAQRLREVKP